MIAGEKPNYPIPRMCEWAGVSEPGIHHTTADRRDQLVLQPNKTNSVILEDPMIFLPRPARRRCKTFR